MDENQTDNTLDQQKKDVKKDFKGFFQSLIEFLTELLDVKKDTDREKTAQNIREGISMQGHTAWILVFSILICSIGLNVSSTAVVIGAMLISPLMGPILGVGFSIGINDIDTLRSSLINLGVMVGLSLITSFLFFSIPLFDDATLEILARTKPDVRDVLIAMSGGLALVIAISRPRPQFNTVAGVAIATALMPPLCTAGYGLANGRFDFFGSAMFLFTINTIFIALAALATTKFLNFPMVKYINQAKRKRISQVASAVALVIFSFSIFLFYRLFVENKYISKATDFIHLLEKEGVNLIGEPGDMIDYDNREIKLFVLGKEYSKYDENRWTNKLVELGLTKTNLNVIQSQNDAGVRDDIDELKSLYMDSNRMMNVKEETIREKDLRIGELEKDLRKYYRQEIQFNQISREVKINHENLSKISFAREYISDFNKIDTVTVVSVHWDTKIRRNQKNLQEEKLKKWLEARLKIDSISIRRAN